METNKNTTRYEVFGITKGGVWEFQDCCTREQAERIGRIIADGYARVVIREAK